jgi:shikimate kinase
MVITLIGYRGSGKSSVAAPLAARLGWDWTDADALIEQRAGKTIREMFATDGEPYFRALERQAMADLLARERLIIAAGGGAVLDPQTRARIRAAGPAVWLHAPAAMLAARIAGDASTAERRPQLTSRGSLEEVAEVLARREPLYRECASLAVDTTALTIPEIVERIVAAYPSSFSPGV